MSDFIREVDEEYRRDRAIKFLTRYQTPLVILAVLVIGGAGGWRWWHDRQVAAAEAINARYMAAADEAKAGNGQAALGDFIAISKDAPTGYATLARLRAAGLLAGFNAEAGAKAFDAIAGDDSLAVSLRDAARLRGAMIRVDSEDPKAFESRYGRFTVPGFAYMNSMRELMALAALKRQDYATASRYLDELIIDRTTPEGMRIRAQAFREIVAAGAATPMTGRPPAAKLTPVGQPGAATPKPATTPAANSPPSASPTPH